MKKILLSSSIFGVLLFGLVFLVTFLSPQLVDTAARTFVVSQIEKERNFLGLKTSMEMRLHRQRINLLVAFALRFQRFLIKYVKLIVLSKKELPLPTQQMSIFIKKLHN